MPVGAGRTSSTSASPTGDSGESARLAAAWGAEAPAIYDWRRTPTQRSDIECVTCGALMFWHSAHTTLVCPSCVVSVTSPGAEARAEAHTAAAHRQARGELAVIDPDAEGRARAARIDLHRKREMLREYTDKALTWCDAEYEYPQDERRAAELGATLRGYLPEIDRAPDIATLAAILGEIRAIRDGDEFTALITAYKQQNERQEAARARAEAWQRAEERRQAEEAEAAREAEAERRRAEAEARQLEQQQRRQLPAARTTTKTLPTNSTALAMAQIMSYMQQRDKVKQHRAQLIERNGTCAFCRKPTPATRVYGIGSFGWNGEASLLTDQPHVRACDKHHTEADTWIEARKGMNAAYFWELTTA